MLRPLEGVITRKGRKDWVSIRLKSGAVIAAQYKEGHIGQLVNIQWDYTRNKPLAVWSSGEDQSCEKIEAGKEVVEELGQWEWEPY